MVTSSSNSAVVRNLKVASADDGEPNLNSELIVTCEGRAAAAAGMFAWE